MLWTPIYQKSPIAADKYILYTVVYMYVYPNVPSKQLLVFKIADRLSLSLPPTNIYWKCCKHFSNTPKKLKTEIKTIISSISRCTSFDIVPQYHKLNKYIAKYIYRTYYIVHRTWRENPAQKQNRKQKHTTKSKRIKRTTQHFIQPKRNLKLKI